VLLDAIGLLAPKAETLVGMSPSIEVKYRSTSKALLNDNPSFVFAVPMRSVCPTILTR